MSFEIRINGELFTLWKSAAVQRSIDSNSGVFRFSNSSKIPLSDYPIRAGDFVEIVIDGERKIAGFVDEITGSQNENSHTIEVSGRDNIADLIDSSVPDDAKVTEGPVSLKQLIEKVVSALGADIKITNSVSGLSDFTSEDLQAAGSGETCMAYLVSFARKRQVYLVPDGSGGLVIYRPDPGNVSGTDILHEINGRFNNVITYSFRRSQQYRFNRYVCKSQDNFGFDIFGDYAGNGTNRFKSVTDGQIRPSRYLEIQAEESMNDQECGSRAAEESNIRRTDGQEYTVSLQGSAQADGTVWDFGQFVNVKDDFADMSGKFLIKSVEYANDTTMGTRTQLSIVPPDAYLVQAEPSKETNRAASTGTGFQQPEPQKQGVIR